MKKIFLLSILLIFVYLSPSFASNNIYEKEIDSVKVKVVIEKIEDEHFTINNLNYKNIYYEETPIIEYEYISSVNISESNSINESVEVPIIFYIEDYSNIDDYVIFGSESRSKTGGGVTATINVNYSISTNGEKIKLNSYSGSWTPSSNIYYVTNRKAGAHTGPFNCVDHISPVSNSFHRNLNCNYNSYVTGTDLSPRVWSEAICKVHDMEGSYKIYIDMTFGDSRN